MIKNIPKNIIDIAAGEAHTILIDSIGNLYVFGDGKYGKLCFKTHLYEYQPIFIDTYKDYHIFKIVCGGCQTIILAGNKSNENREEISKSTLNNFV